MVRKIIRFIDNMIDKTVFLVCLVLFLLGSYGLYDKIRENAQQFNC